MTRTAKTTTPATTTTTTTTTPAAWVSLPGEVTLRLLRACNEITAAGKDKLSHVYAATPTTLEATDGYRLIRVTCDQPHGLAVGYYHGSAGAPVAPKADWTPWPDFEPFFPRVDFSDTATPPKTKALQLDARLLASTAEAVRMALSPGRGHDPVVQINVYGPTEPIRISGTYAGITADALLMPRI
jgi:hypothetical protein